MEHATQFTAIIADDEPSILNGLKEAVCWNQLDISLVALARDGKEALEQIMEQNPDIAIIDIRMPLLNGLEVIRGARDGGCTTDFIILSGYDDFTYAKEAIRYGAKAYLLKPLNPEELYDELYRLRMERAKIKNASQSTVLTYPGNPSLTFFNNLIDKKVLDSSSIQRMLLSSGSSLSDSPCYVMVLLYDPPLSEESDSLFLKQALVKLEEVFQQVRHKFWPYNDQKFIGLFNTSAVTPFQTAWNCLEVLRANHFPLPMIGVGDTVSGLFECSYSYNRALTALTYQLYDDRTQIFTYEMICTVPPQKKLSDIDYLPLVQYIVKKDKTGIQNYCNEFINSLLYVKYPPPNYVMSLCYALSNLIEKEFSNFSHQDIAQNTSAKDLYQFKKLSQIRQWLIDSFYRLSDFVDAVYGYSEPNKEIGQNLAEDIEDEIIRTAKEYIHDNILSHIKIEDIARQVHLSPSYFAIYFKNKTHMNLRDYLLKEKMEYARQKLMDPNVSISEIAYDIGYGDYRSFSRAFKNIHGVTPSDFQNRKK